MRSLFPIGLRKQYMMSNVTDVLRTSARAFEDGKNQSAVLVQRSTTGEK